MIVTEMRPFDTIKTQIKKSDKICIVSCNTCARKCETGGVEAMSSLADKFREEGFNIIGENLVGMPCGLKQINDIMLEGDVAVVLGCDASIHALKMIYPEVKIVPALNTVGLGSWDENGKVNIVRKFS